MCTNLAFRLLWADLSYILFQSCYLRHPVDVRSERCISLCVRVRTAWIATIFSKEIVLQNFGHCNRLQLCFVLMVSDERAIKQTADKNSIFACGFLLRCFTLQPFKLASS